jgi:hypothetical protein
MESPNFSQLLDVFTIILATFRQILMRKAKVFAKIRKRKLLFQLYLSVCDEQPRQLCTVRKGPLWFGFKQTLHEYLRKSQRMFRLNPNHNGIFTEFVEHFQQCDSQTKLGFFYLVTLSLSTHQNGQLRKRVNPHKDQWSNSQLL